MHRDNDQISTRYRHDKRQSSRNETTSRSNRRTQCQGVKEIEWWKISIKIGDRGIVGGENKKKLNVLGTTVRTVESEDITSLELASKVSLLDQAKDL